MFSVGNIVDSVIDEISSILVELAKSVLSENFACFNPDLGSKPAIFKPISIPILRRSAEIWKCLTKQVTSLSREHQNKIEPD